MDLKKVCGRVNREALWKVLRINDVGGKFLNGVTSMYVNSLDFIRIKQDESEFQD